METMRKRARNGTSKKSKKRKIEVAEEPDENGADLVTQTLVTHEAPPSIMETMDGGAIACTTNSSKKSSRRKASAPRKQPAAAASSSVEEAPKLTKHIKKTRFNILKPRQKSWMHHIAGNVVYQLVFQAVRNIKYDPRRHPDTINWQFWAKDILDGDSLAKIWWYITKEYPEVSLQDILADLEPYNKCTYHDLKVEDLKKRYEGECPKPPVTAYLQFIKERGPKLKKEKPELSAKEITKDLAKQWSSMGSKQERYKKKYINARAEYELKLKDFYEHHPEAKPQRKSAKTRLKPKDFEIKDNDATSEKIRKLKKIAPKQATPPFMLFCADKRREFHDKNPGMTSTEVTSLLGQQWNQFTDAQKRKYIDLHEEKVREREESMKSFYELYPEAEELLKTRTRRQAKKSPKVSTSTDTDEGPAVNIVSNAKATKRLEDKIKLQTTKLKTMYMQQELAQSRKQDEDEEEEEEEYESEDADDEDVDEQQEEEEELEDESEESEESEEEEETSSEESDSS